MALDFDEKLNLQTIIHCRGNISICAYAKEWYNISRDQKRVIIWVGRYSLHW